MGQLDWLKAHNNEFWNSVRQHHLGGFLDQVYTHPWKSKLIQKWLGARESKRIVIRQSDFYCDPLVIEFRQKDYQIRVSEDEPNPPAEVEIEATHSAIIASSTELSWFLRDWLGGEIKVNRLFARFRDHLYAAVIFLYSPIARKT